jgi:hypothetical protein
VKTICTSNQIDLQPFVAIFIHFSSCTIGTVIVELSLNLAWAALAATTLVFWPSIRPCQKANCGIPLATLTVCILILLPVISIPDDLMAPQFPAETDASLRSGYRPSINHSLSHRAPVSLHSPFACLVTWPLAKLAAKSSHLAYILPQVTIRPLNRPPPFA